jgi:hypothetical protein
VRLEVLMIRAMKIVVFLDVTLSTTESHVKVLKLEVLHHLAKMNAGIQTGVTLILKLVYPSCKEFHGLLLITLYHTLPSECTAFEAVCTTRMFEHLPSHDIHLVLHFVSVAT